MPPNGEHESTANAVLELHAALGVLAREVAESKTATIELAVMCSRRFDNIEVMHARLLSRLGLVERRAHEEEDTLSEMKQLAPQARAIIRRARWWGRWRKRLLVTAILAAMASLGAAIGNAVASKAGLPAEGTGHHER